MEETKPATPTSKARMPLLFALTLAVGMFIGQKLPHYDRHFLLGEGLTASSSVSEILRYVDALYVDNTNQDSLSDAAIAAMLEQLDPHSLYIRPEELQATEDDLNGGFEGVGIEFSMLADTLNIVAPLSGGPAEKAGILAGDKLIRVGDSVVAGIKLDQDKLYQLLRGPAESVVKLGILRGNEQNMRFFDVSRALIPVKSLDAAYMVDDKTGYFKLNKFTSESYQEFMGALAEMIEKNKLENVILDLRDNTGGYLDAATSLLSQFFSEGKLLLYTEARNKDRTDYKSNGRARFTLGKVAVLINEGSASASEIVAGAIQDWDRGWVVGRRSYGKGLVQETYPLSNGGALRLTVSRYFTPSGRSIQRAYKGNADYKYDTEKRLESGELVDDSKSHRDDTTKYYTGMGRVVYAKGGISPDVFVPLDTSYYSTYFFEVLDLLPLFTARHLDGLDRSSLPATEADFIASYTVPDGLHEAACAFAEKNGVARSPKDIERSRAQLKLQIKAQLAKRLFGTAAFYKALNRDDAALQKAVDLIQKDAPLTGARG